MLETEGMNISELDAVCGRGGLLRPIEGGTYSVNEAKAYQIAKEIGSAATVLQGHVDAIILTGGLAYGNEFIELISSKTDWISDVLVYPGEDELEALAKGAIRVLSGEEKAKNYPS